MKSQKVQLLKRISQDGEELFRVFANQNIDGMILIDPEATVVEWNRILEELIGLSAGEVIGMKVWDLQMLMVAENKRTPETNERYKREFSKIIKHGVIPPNIAASEAQVYRKDGKQIFVEQKLFVIQTEKGNWIGGLIRDTTERKLVSEQIKKQAARAEALSSFSQLLTQVNQDYQLVLEAVVKHCAELIGDGASVFLYSPEKEFLDLAAVYNPNPEVTDIFRQEMLAHPIRADEGAYKRVIETQRPVLIPSISLDELIKNSSPDRRAYYQKLPLYSMILAPLHVYGEVFGVIGLGRHTPGKGYTPDDLTFLEDIAHRSAMAMLNARLYQKLEQELIQRETLITELENKNAQAETLREITNIVASTLDISETVQQLLEQLKRVVQYNSASVWLYSADTAKMIGYEGLPETAIAPGEYEISDSQPDYPLRQVPNIPYILLHDIQENYPQFHTPTLSYIRGWMAIPLRARGRLTGFIALDGTKPGQFSEEDAQTALIYANQVSIALENARLFANLQSELAERQRLIAELEEKNAELERFTYTASHDLKSPLITINGYLGYLEEDVKAGNTQRVEHDSQRIQEAVNKMHFLLDDLLELSRIGRLMNTPENVPFADLVHEALKNIQGRLKAQNIAIKLEPSLPTVYVDHQRLVESLQNLIENAAKFMGEQPDPCIEIGQFGEEHGRPILFVRDNGIGILSKYHERVFGLFDKLDPKTEGTGIGLAIVKRIIEFHEGRIWVESQVGQGSTFYFTLPTKS